MSILYLNAKQYPTNILLTIEGTLLEDVLERL